MEAIEARITGVNPIVWMQPRSFPFLCFLCGHNEAMNKITIRDGEAVVNVCLCQACAQIPADEILAGMLSYR